MRSKYRNKKTDGFDSKREAKRAQELQLLQQIGEITGLEYQAKFELLPVQLIPGQKSERPVHYVADFKYYDKKGKLVIEDAKGMRTREYVIKRKLLLWRHGIRVMEV